jgi:hypothetical protein
MRRLLLFSAVVLVGATPAWAQARNSTVTIVHGLPEFTADIYVDGELLLSGFRPEEATDPMELPAGTYHVDIRNAGDPEDAAPALAADLQVPGGKNLSVIAHLNESGEPTVSVFDNDVSPVPAGRSRLLLRHQAAASPVDLLVDGKSVVRNVASGEQDGMVIPSAPHEIAVEGEDGDSLPSPTSLEVEDGTAYYLYLIGSTEEATLDLMVQPVTGLDSAPSGVATGNGGLAEPQVPWGLVSIMVLAAAGLAVGAREVLGTGR